MCVSQFAAARVDVALGQSLACREVLCSLAVLLNIPFFFPRCVSDRQRSFALGIQWIVVRTLGIVQSDFVCPHALLAVQSMHHGVLPKKITSWVGREGGRTRDGERRMLSLVCKEKI